MGIESIENCAGERDREGRSCSLAARSKLKEGNKRREGRTREKIRKTKLAAWSLVLEVKSGMPFSPVETRWDFQTGRGEDAKGSFVKGVMLVDDY